jgi:hypothetical protein
MNKTCNKKQVSIVFIEHFTESFTLGIIVCLLQKIKIIKPMIEIISTISKQKCFITSSLAKTKTAQKLGNLYKE